MIQKTNGFMRSFVCSFLVFQFVLSLPTSAFAGVQQQSHNSQPPPVPLGSGPLPIPPNADALTDERHDPIYYPTVPDEDSLGVQIMPTAQQEEDLRETVREEQLFESSVDQVEAASLDLFALMRADYRERVDEIGLQAVADMVEDDKYTIFNPVPGFKSGEIKFVENKVVVKGVLDNGRAVIVYDSAEINKDSLHLAQYIARQLVDSGENRLVWGPDGEPVYTWTGRQKTETGRDTIILAVNAQANSIESRIDRNRAPLISYREEEGLRFQGLKDWFTAKWKKPTFDDFTFGLTTGGILQSAAVFGISSIMHHFHPTQPIPWHTMGWTFAFGTTVGTLTRTYQNIVYPGSAAQRRRKASYFSRAFNYVNIIITDPGGIHAGVSSLLAMNAKAAMIHVNSEFIVNVNNRTKDGISRIPNIRRKERLSRGSVKFNILGIPFDWNLSALEGNLGGYLPQFGLKITDTLAAQNFHIGHIPFTQYIPDQLFAGGHIPGSGLVMPIAVAAVARFMVLFIKNVSIPYFQLIGYPISREIASTWIKKLGESYQGPPAKLAKIQEQVAKELDEWDGSPWNFRNLRKLDPRNISAFPSYVSQKATDAKERAVIAFRVNASACQDLLRGLRTKLHLQN